MSREVKVRKGEPMERALRRLKKRLDREGVIRDVRAKRYFVKPAQAKRRKKKELDFNNMLRVRYSNMSYSKLRAQTVRAPLIPVRVVRAGIFFKHDRHFRSSLALDLLVLRSAY